jgi:hypothetical protein
MLATVSAFAPVSLSEVAATALSNIFFNLTHLDTIDGVSLSLKNDINEFDIDDVVKGTQIRFSQGVQLSAYLDFPELDKAPVWSVLIGERILASLGREIEYLADCEPGWPNFRNFYVDAVAMNCASFDVIGLPGNTRASLKISTAEMPGRARNASAEGDAKINPKVALHLRLGSVELVRSELRTISSGSFLFLVGAELESFRGCQLFLKGAKCPIAPYQFQLPNVLHMESSDTSDSQTPSALSADLLDEPRGSAGDPRVALYAFLELESVTVSELRGLSEGTCLPVVGSNALGRVRIATNSETIGIGQIVKVGSQLAILIETVYKPSGAGLD